MRIKKMSGSKRATRKKWGSVAVLCLVLLVAFARTAFLATQFFGAKRASAQTVQTSPPAMSSPEEIKRFISDVEKHIVVKEGETPTIATVQDPDLLRAQNPAFYKDAQKGDRLYVWTDKAVLYSTSKDVLLAVMPISAQPASVPNPKK